jgi:hypothetical protein
LFGEIPPKNMYFRCFFNAAGLPASSIMHVSLSEQHAQGQLNFQCIKIKTLYTDSSQKYLHNSNFPYIYHNTTIFQKIILKSIHIRFRGHGKFLDVFVTLRLFGYLKTEKEIKVLTILMK